MKKEAPLVVNLQELLGKVEHDLYRSKSPHDLAKEYGVSYTYVCQLACELRKRGVNVLSRGNKTKAALDEYIKNRKNGS